MYVGNRCKCTIPVKYLVCVFVIDTARGPCYHPGNACVSNDIAASGLPKPRKVSMEQTYLYAPLLTLGLWLSLTAGLLRLNQRGPRIGRIALVATLPLLFLAHQQLWATQHDLSILGAYRSYVAASLIWAWHELGFYSGVLSGPWRSDCPPSARGIRRFGYALSTHLYHELACLVELILLQQLLGDATNRMGLLVFVLSWALQHSAKLNVLLGVRSLQAELFPTHLRYLASFWARRSANPFFIPSVSVASLLAILLWFSVGAHAPDPVAVRLALLASLVTLGALEHWLLIVPALRTRTAPSTGVAE